MTTYYIDFSAQTNGDGTDIAPFNAIPALASNNTYLFKRGTKSTFSNVEYVLTLTGLTGVVFGAYGLGPRPILSGEMTGVWLYDPVNAVWYSESFNTTRGPGCVTDSGQPLTWVKWNTDIATTAASMPNGSFSLNHTTSPKRLYARPRTGVENLLVASSFSAIYRGRSPTGSVVVEDLQLDYFSGNCINLGGAVGARIARCLIRFPGGFRNTSANFTGGAGIQIYDDSDGVDICDCEILDSFDSGITPQAFVDNRSIRNVRIYRNTIKRFALGGVEVATFNPGTVLSGIDVFGNYIEGGGRGYSGLGDEPPGGENEVVPAALYADFAATTTRVDCMFRDNVVVDCYYAGSIRGSNDNTSVQWVRNRVSRCDYGFRLRCRSFGATYGLATVVADNFVVDTLYDGIVMSAQFGSTNTTRVINNTFVGLGRAAVRQTYSVSGWLFKNNVLKSSGAEAALSILGGTPPASGANCFVGFGTNYVGMPDPGTDMTVDPRLDASGRPKNDSPLIAAGAHMGYRRDFDGKQRPNPPSIGAFDVAKVKPA